MGGQSFQCPECGRTFMARGAVRDHLTAVHGLAAHFEIIGSGAGTRVVRLMEGGAVCPRVYRPDTVRRLLESGLTLYIDRRDAPELADVSALEAQGLVTIDLETISEQYSRLVVRWATRKD